jgi:hypothetical protein
VFLYFSEIGNLKLSSNGFYKLTGNFTNRIVLSLKNKSFTIKHTFTPAKKSSLLGEEGPGSPF